MQYPWSIRNVLHASATMSNANINFSISVYLCTSKWNGLYVQDQHKFKKNSTTAPSEIALDVKK